MDKYPLMCDAHWNAKFAPDPSLACSILRYPSLTIKVLVTSGAKRGHKGDPRALVTFHALSIGDRIRPLIASIKYVTGGEGHMAGPGPDGHDWFDGTIADLRRLCACHLNVLGYAWQGVDLAVESEQVTVRAVQELLDSSRCQSRYKVVGDTAPPTVRGHACVSQCHRSLDVDRHDEEPSSAPHTVSGKRSRSRKELF